VLDIGREKLSVSFVVASDICTATIDRTYFALSCQQWSRAPECHVIRTLSMM